MKYRVNWTFELDGKTMEEGEEIDLTDEQAKSLNGSAVVTKLKDVDADVKREDAERKKAEAEAAEKAAAEAAEKAAEATNKRAK